MTHEPLITTRFNATSTADDIVRGVDLQGRQAIVTGASSGIGTETARALTAAGAAVTLAVRNVDAGATAAEEIAVATGRARPEVRALDLADPASVATLVRQWSSPLDILVTNAGLVTAGLQRTPQGWELQFATNHLGHFALALGLHPHLAAAAAARGGSRVVVLSSTAHMRAPVDFDDIPVGPSSSTGWNRSSRSTIADGRGQPVARHVGQQAAGRTQTRGRARRAGRLEPRRSLGCSIHERLRGLLSAHRPSGVWSASPARRNP